MPEPGPDGGSPRRTPRLALWGVSGLLAVGAGYLALAAATTDRIPGGTSVGGVDVGGMSRAQARHALDGAVADRLRAPLTVTAGGHTVRVVPAQAGIGLRVGDALDGLTGFTLSPGALLDRFTGTGEQRHLTVQVDRAALQDAVDDAASGISGAAREGSAGYRDGRPVILRHGNDGLRMDAAPLADAIARRWPGATTYTTTMTHRAPAVTDADLQAWVDGPGTAAVAAPVQLRAGDRTVQVAPERIAEVLTAHVDDGRVTTAVDPQRYAELLDEVAPELTTPPGHGRIGTGADGARTYTAGRAGATPVTALSAPGFVAAATSAEHRTLTFRTTPTPSPWTVERLEAVRADEQVSTFDTVLPGGPVNAARTKNIRIALNRIDGLVVGKGEQFSLLGALGTLKKKDGYVDAPTIQGGIERPGLGGGLSQVSTTLYNAAFFAGVQLDEHTPHAFWIARYPMGREATLWEGAIDNKWTNTTDGPILIRAGVVQDDTGADQVRVTFLGTPTYEVRTATSAKHDLVAPKQRTIDDPHCIPQPAVDGFTVDVSRVVTRDGRTVSSGTIRTRYQPADRVTCATGGSGHAAGTRR